MNDHENENAAKRECRRNIIMSGLVSFFTDIAGYMIVPVLPLFLVGALGASTMLVGLIEGIAETTASLLKIFSGWFSDKVGKRKPLMLIGYSLSNIIRPLFGLSTGWGQVLAIKFADKVGKGLRTAPRDALLADSATEGGMGKAFGLHRTFDELGSAIGPLLAFWILSFFAGDYRQVFYWTAIPGALAILLIIVGIRDKAPKHKEESKTIKLGFKGMGHEFILFSMIATIFAIGNSSDAFLILRAKDVGLATALVPLAYFAFNITFSILSYPMGALSDKLGRRPLLIGGFFIFGLVYLGFAFASRTWHIWLLFIAYGIYSAATDGIQRAYIADLIPAGKRGMGMGTFNALVGLAALPASILAGYLWKIKGPVATFGFGSLMAFLACFLLIILSRKVQAPQDLIKS
ncbi:MAG: MFS transporter [Syntrophomonas sp.]|nr:MFS transporter [Syntrophomonas sp.]